MRIKKFELQGFDHPCRGEDEDKLQKKRKNPVLSSFEEGELLDYQDDRKTQLAPIIKQEFLDAQKNEFNILPVVEEYRGIKEQKDREYQDKIKRVAAEKMYQYKEKAYQDGLEKGRQEGFQSVRDELSREIEEKVSEFAQHVENVRSEHEQLLLKQKDKIYEMVKTLTKWVILRELKNDGKYLERLLDKLILELNSRSNLLIKVGQENFEKVSGILEVFENQFKGIKNTRIEAIQDKDELLRRGLILESENDVLDASFKAQFKTLDRLFSELSTDERV